MIAAALSGDRLPERNNEIRHANYPPEQEAIPDVVYLLYSLGLLRDPSYLALYSRVVDLIESTEEAIRNWKTGTFYYVECVAWCLEQMRDPGAISILRRLHAFPALHNQVSREPFQADFFLESQAFLELAIVRAQAYCGDGDGMLGLFRYLNDTRALLAWAAHDALADLTGLDLGLHAARWQTEFDCHRLPWFGPERQVPGVMSSGTL